MFGPSCWTGGGGRWCRKHRRRRRVWRAGSVAGWIGIARRERGRAGLGIDRLAPLPMRVCVNKLANAGTAWWLQGQRSIRCRRAQIPWGKPRCSTEWSASPLAPAPCTTQAQGPLLVRGLRCLVVNAATWRAIFKGGRSAGRRGPVQGAARPGALWHPPRH